MIKSHMPSFLWPTRYGSLPPPQSLAIACASVATGHLQKWRRLSVCESTSKNFNKHRLKSVALLLPKEQKKKQRDPESIHEMPVDRGRISRACAPQFALDCAALSGSAQQQIT